MYRVNNLSRLWSECRGGEGKKKKNNTTGSVYGTANKTIQNEFSRGLEAKRPVSQRCEYCCVKKKKNLTRFICINKRDHGNGFMVRLVRFPPVKFITKSFRLYVHAKFREYSYDVRNEIYLNLCENIIVFIFIHSCVCVSVCVQKGNKVLEK